ncbi:glycosyltransferase [Paraconexibacter sp. AEG42_29]|uniref:Glycosyltransferase n=1 Tax=Paraconexibacter sp. AEG42_29 TaxID=2997339 RepID=A0AAU7AUR3_9ACTN
MTRALTRGLAADEGVEVTLLAGSRHDQSGHGDARRFYTGLDLHEVDFTPSLAAADPTAHRATVPGTAPLQPSYEDRPNASDRVFTRLDAAAFEEHVSAWSRELVDAGAATADVLHLHHLTPLHEAAARVAPDVPVVTHLHGTELLLLEAIEAGELGGPHAQAWRERLCRWAHTSACLIVAPGNRARAMRVLDLGRDRFAELPNGFDPVTFRPLRVNREAVWRRVLVDEPRGWLPDAGPGSIAYDADVLERFRHGPVVLFVGRFTSVKRLPLLLDCFAAAQARTPLGATLVLVGGHPGEWEGEHPADAVARLGRDDVLLAGWHEQDELPELLAAADLLVLPSARESFGQVIVEAMACGVAPVAAASLGPARIIEDGRTGWLFDVDDADALTHALTEALSDAGERQRRAAAGERSALERFTWPAVAAQLADLLRAAAGDVPRQTQSTRDR